MPPPEPGSRRTARRRPHAASRSPRAAARVRTRGESRSPFRKGTRLGRFTAKFAVTALILIAIWWILSGKFDLLHFGTGVAAAIVIAANAHGVEDRTRFHFVRVVAYFPWLAWQVFLSNLRVARMVFSPKMPIRPQFVRQAPGVAGPRALTMLGMSITLTPGTLTVDVDDDEIFVHALDQVSADDVRAGIMASRVSRIFQEGGP